jgi:hypothetical protein
MADETEDPLDFAKWAVAETELIKAELRGIMLGLGGRKLPPGARPRVKQLKARWEQLVATFDLLLLRQDAIEIVVRERLGRVDVEGETITAEDGVRADELLAGLRLC